MSRSKNEYDTAEAWLRAFIEAVRPEFELLGYKLPAEIDLDHSFTHTGTRKGSNGEFWDASASSNGRSKIILRHDTADIETITGGTYHQLGHAAVGAAAGHGKPFRDWALRSGMEGKMREAMPGPRLQERLNAIAEQLGPFPRGALDFQKYSPDGKEKRVVDRADPQRGRQLKAECLIDGCGYIARVSALHLRRGAPVCPVHLQPMWHEELPPEQVEKPAAEEAEASTPAVQGTPAEEQS